MIIIFKQLGTGRTISRLHNEDLRSIDQHDVGGNDDQNNRLNYFYN